MSVDLGGEDFEDRRPGQEVLAQPGDGSSSAAFSKFLQEQRKEVDEEDKQDADDGSLNPLEDWVQVVAALLTRDQTAIVVVSAERDFTGESTQVEKSQHEDLDRQDDEDVVDVETGVTVVESEESVQRKLTAKVVVLATEHLFSHTGADLGLEVENGAETEITSFAALIVLRVLDPSTTSKGVHTGEDILVQVQSLLSFGNTATSVHEGAVKEIRMSVVQLASNPCQRTGE